MKNNNQFMKKNESDLNMYIEWSYLIMNKP